jgi:hypothetical protein
VAAANLVAGRPLILDDGDIIFGNSSLQADRTWTFTPNGAPLNSVRVNGRRTESSLSGAVPLFFAPILGVQRFEPTQTATVVKLDRDICLVVDRSSSMKLDLSTTAQTMSLSDPRANLPPDCSNSRWAALKDAVDEFLDTLDETPQSEHVALASFASDFTWAGVTNRATDLDVPLSANASGIRSQMTTIGNRVFNGATYSAAGVDVGIAALTDPSRARPFAAKTMVYMTDGYRTVGNSPVTNAQAAAAQKITIHTITFGAVFDQTEMVQVAQTTGGNYYHAANANALRDIFREIALTLPLTFAE